MSKDLKISRASSGDSDLNHLQCLVDESSKTNSRLAKIAAIRTHGEHIKVLLNLIYSYHYRFGVTPKNLKKYSDTHTKKLVKPVDSIVTLLTGLSDRKWTGHAALDQCLSFIHHHPKHADIILRAIDKDLKCKFGASSINKAMPNTVPVFQCSLALQFEKHEDFFTKTGFSKWKTSRKVDGTRGVVICDENVTVYSRYGEKYPECIPGLKRVIDVIRKHFKNVVVDGEFTLIDENGDEHFDKTNSIMNPNATPESVLKKGKVHIPDSLYLVFQPFDLIPLDVYNGKAEGETFFKRYEKLRKMTIKSKYVVTLPQYDSKDYEEFYDSGLEKGWEGIMLRHDSLYFTGKKKFMLKMKPHEDAEFKIIKSFVGPMKDPKSSVEHQVMNRVVIDYKGNEVGVGGGFSWEQRVKWKDGFLVGQIATIRFTEESKDRNGKLSLRYPRFKAIHGTKRVN